MNVAPPLRRSTRNLDKLGEDIMSDIKEKEIKTAARNNKESSNRSYQNKYDYRSSTRIYNKPIEKKEEVIINTLDTELFPSLGGLGSLDNTVKKAKLSVWNITNHNITTVKPVLEPELKTTVNSQTNSTKIITNITNHVINSNRSEDDLYDSDVEYMEDLNNGNENTYIDAEDDEDYDEVYIREMYEKKNELINNIEFVKRTYDSRNNFHLKFLCQLEYELVDIEDKIYRNECLENELEKIYGPKHIPYKSLYDEEVEKREEEERRIKSEKSINPFLLELNKLKS
jgi:hypothetical protein